MTKPSKRTTPKKKLHLPPSAQGSPLVHGATGAALNTTDFDSDQAMTGDFRLVPCPGNDPAHPRHVATYLSEDEGWVVLPVTHPLSAGLLGATMLIHQLGQGQ